MKISIFVAIMGMMGAFASTYSQETKLSLELNNVTIKELFNVIGQKSEFSFWYSNKELNDKETISISVKNQTIDNILSIALENQNLTYEVKDKVVVIYKPYSTKKDSKDQSSQMQMVNGKVTDALSGEPLPGVNVIIEGTLIGATTDAKGNYSIMVSSPENVLIFSYIGYNTEKVIVGEKSIIDVTLVPEITALDEIVIVAYGNTTQRKSTGALQTIKSDEIQDITGSQFTQQLQGKLAGVRINQATGRLGEGLIVQVRGAASISANSSPLYVVDGFPIVGALSNINPDEIESITVLKDAASTALYGSRAAFGVVLITTKTAKEGKTQISVNVNSGFQKVPQKGRPDMMNGTEWAQFKKESYEDRGQTAPEIFQNPEEYGEGYDWYDAMLRTGTINDYNINIRAAKDNLSTSIVAGYYDQKGVLLNSNYRRFSLRANNKLKINDRLVTGFNIAPTYSEGNFPPSDGQFFSSGGLLLNAALTPPIINYQDEDGSYPVSVTTSGVTAFSTPNWVRSVKDITNWSGGNRLLSNAYIELELITNLKLKSTINVDLGQSNWHYFQPSTAGRAFAAEPNALRTYLNETNEKYWSWLSENTATYSKELNDHNFEILGGYTAQKYRFDRSRISGSQFADDRIQTIEAALVKDNPTTDIEEWSLLSYIGRLNYNYKNKYVFSASLRRDGSSRFGSDNKWGNFPAISVAWVITEESFAQNTGWLNFLKVRAGYGLTGNNNIGNYRHYKTVENANTVFNNSSVVGTAVTRMGNVELGWESTKDLDIGLDAAFFEGRLSFNYDYYYKKTEDLLYEFPIPVASGFSNFIGNIGEIHFWGHEFNINSNNLTGEFKWSSSFNISFNDNEVKALSTTSDTLVSYTGFISSITRVGSRIGQFYGLVQEGVYVDQTDFDNSPKHVDAQVGTIKYRDVNGDGVITSDDSGGDKTEIGNPFPKFIFGFTNNFSYKNIDLSILISGAYGNKIVAATEQGLTNLDGVFNVLKEVEGRWRSESNPGEGKYGKTIAATFHERDFFHSRFVNDGSYLTIKNITLGYTLPTGSLKFVNNVRLYTSANQLYVFTKYKYGNPEISVDFNGNIPGALNSGIDYSAYPVPRSYTFGLNVNLK